MDRIPRLICINGPAGSGKSTLAQKYVDNHALALHASTDHIIAMLGQWLTHEEAARGLAFQLLSRLVDTHLAAGYDVVVPHLLTRPEEAATLEQIARGHSAGFFECTLVISKRESTARMLERGTWGEPGAPPLTAADVPTIEELFDKHQLALQARPDAERIIPVDGDIAGTYAKLMAAIKATGTTSSSKP